MKSKNNRKDFIWNALGLTLNSLNSLFFLIVVRYINGMDTAGIFTYAFALCAFFYVIAFYFNRSFQVSDSKDKFSFNDYLSARVVLSILSFILIFAFAIINQFSIFEISVIMLLMIFRLTETIGDCFYGAIHKKSKLWQTGFSLSIKAVFGLLVFFITDLTTKNLLISISSLSLVNIIIFLVYDVRNYKNLYTEKIKFNFSHFKQILKSCFPIFLFQLLSLYLANCQKYILPYFEPNEAQTILGILIMPATLLSLVGSYLINPVLEPLTSHFKNRDLKNFVLLSKKVLSFLTILGILIVAICYFLGVPFLNLLYSLNLDQYNLPFITIIIGSIFFAASLIISNFLTVLKENVKQTYIYIITVIVDTLISILLIKNFGIPGAAYSFAISGGIILALYILLFQRTIKKIRNNHA